MKKFLPFSNSALIIFSGLYIVFGTITHLDPIPNHQPVWAIVCETASAVMVVVLGFTSLVAYLYLRLKKSRTKAEREEMQATIEILLAVSETMYALNKESVRRVLNGSGVDSLLIPEEQKRKLVDKPKKLLMLPEDDEHKSNHIRKEIGEMLLSGN